MKPGPCTYPNCLDSAGTGGREKDGSPSILCDAHRILGQRLELAAHYESRGELDTAVQLYHLGGSPKDCDRLVEVQPSLHSHLEKAIKASDRHAALQHANALLARGDHKEAAIAFSDADYHEHAEEALNTLAVQEAHDSKIAAIKAAIKELRGK